MNQPPKRHLFVVGFARSGTSLLYSLLNLHPKIRLLFEADLLSHSLIDTSIRTGQNWWERLDFYNSSFRRHGLKPLPAWKNIRSAKEAAAALYAEYGGNEAQYVGEKSPSYYNCLPKLAREFPDARFIVIWRNPHSIISSILSAGKNHYFFSNGSLPLRALIGFEQMQQDVLALRAQGTPVFDLCYEDLADKTEPWLRSICDFLEIPFAPRMLELDHADCSMFPPGEHHAKVRSGLLKRSHRSGDAPEDPFQREIPFYLARWKELFGDRLATKRYWRSTDSKGPHSFEITRNKFRYRLAKFYSEQIDTLEFDAPWTAFHGKYRLHRWPWSTIFQLVGKLRRQRFAAAVSVRADPRDHLLMWLAGARRRVGFPSRWSRPFLNEPVAHDPKTHKVEDWWKLQDKLTGTGEGHHAPRLVPDSAFAKNFATLLQKDSRPVIAVHCGARIPVRRWPEAYYRQVILNLRQKFDFQLVLIPDPDGYGAALSDLADHTFTKLNLHELPALLSCANAVLCNDSGPCHIAAALGIPVIVFFGPQLPELFRPFGDHHLVVIRDLCVYRPCSDYCRYPEPYCLTKLTPEITWPEIENHLLSLKTIPLKR